MKEKGILRGIPAMKKDAYHLSNVEKAIPKNSLFEVYPEVGSTGISANVVPIINFNEKMMAATLNEDNIILFDGRGNRILSKLSVDGGSVAIKPEKELEAGGKYCIFVGKNIRYENGKKAGVDNRASHFFVQK